MAAGTTRPVGTLKTASWRWAVVGGCYCGGADSSISSRGLNLNRKRTYLVTVFPTGQPINVAAVVFFDIHHRSRCSLPTAVTHPRWCGWREAAVAPRSSRRAANRPRKIMCCEPAFMLLLSLVVEGTACQRRTKRRAAGGPLSRRQHCSCTSTRHDLAGGAAFRLI